MSEECLSRGLLEQVAGAFGMAGLCRALEGAVPAEGLCPLRGCCS